MLAELRQVIPAFLARVDQPDRGGRWIEYLADDATGVRSDGTRRWSATSRRNRATR